MITSDLRRRLRRVISRDAEALRVAEDAKSEAATAGAMANANRVDLGEGEIVLAAFVNVAIGLKPVALSVAGARLGDRVTLRPTATWPAGFAPTDYVFVAAPDVVDIRLWTPVVTIATTIRLPYRLTALRPL